MTPVLLVFAGGGIGAVLRYLSVHALFGLGGIGAAWAIMGVNIVGSLLMGMALAMAERGILGLGTVQMQILLMTGVLGGFTTFSAFSADVLKMMQNGHIAAAGLYIAGSLLLSLLAVVAGYSLMMMGKNI